MIEKKKEHSVFVCKYCGYKVYKWCGKCFSCNKWDSFEERKAIDKPKEIIKKTPLLTKRVITGEFEIFEEIWEERDHISYLSGFSLEKYKYSKFFVNCFAHILAKGKNHYHKFKLNKNNIVLLTPEEHYLFDFGTIEQRSKYEKELISLNICKHTWDDLYNLKKDLILQYNNQFK